MTIQTIKTNSTTKRRVNINDWLRPSDWVAMPVRTSASDNKVDMVVAVYNSTLETFTFSMTVASGTYTVDWGDGNTETVTSAATASHTYDFSSLSSATTSYGYKTALITAYPTSAVDITAFNLGVAAQRQEINILDLSLAIPTSATLSLGSTSKVMPLLERICNISCKFVATSTSLFKNCYSLKKITHSIDITGSTNIVSMFENCYAIEYIPSITGYSINAGATCTSAFSNCTSLKEAPYLNIANTVGANGMFNGCYELVYVPENIVFNLSTAQTMFSSCISLKQLDCTFNLSSCTTTRQMFDGCIGLQQAPASLNTTSTSLTDISGMFNNCYSLVSIPDFTTTNATSSLATLSGLFTNCYSLRQAPTLDLSKIVNVSYTFANCYSLIKIPTYSFAGHTGVAVTTMWQNCNALAEIPAIAMPSSVTSYSNIFPTYGSLRKMRMTGLKYSFNLQNNVLDKTEIETIFTNLNSNVSAQTATLSSNPGAPTASTISNCSTYINTAAFTGNNQAAAKIGMTVTGTGSPLTTAIAVTFTASTKRVSLTGGAAHGLSQDMRVAFPTVVTTTGISVNTIYYVNYVSTTTFELATTPGGTSITFTNNGTGTMKYECKLTSTYNAGSYTTSTPLTANGTAITLSVQALDVTNALLKGWSVSS